MQINLPTELLRTFVTVIEVESYTHAAALLGRTQPAVSLQMKRLEELVGQPLVLRQGRSVALTERGQALIDHARQILRLNDLAVSQFDTASNDNALRVGLPVDYGVRMLQSCLTRIIRQNPDFRTEIRCDLSRNLINALRRDELDIAVGLYPGGDQQFLHRNWVEKPVWVAAKGKTFCDVEELPLIAHPQGCVYRDRMTDALKQAKRRWRIAFSSPGITSVQQAVLDGMGVSCLTGPTMLDGLVRLSPDMGLPDLEPLHIGLFYRQTHLAQNGHQIINEIEVTLKEAVA
ncbi:LysR substrate-binding domain-containing protein [Phaeobacter marinintestinus]|uniref:LysR substrate-binding domain-containing protein n=1 Tax=Falsiphaeobacter marinintestinus TaxID=1492905 RepID=UPI0011B5995D|nr:LysR family transcriptional regulator [Phaeobacter marinintestinus]